MIRELGGDGTPELATVARLDVALFAADGWDLHAWQELAGGPGRRTWIAQDVAGRVVGYALSATVGDLGELLRIAVRPGVRRQGTAGALLAEVLAAAGSDGAQRLLLEVSESNSGARAFYAVHGFTEIDRRPRYYRDGTAALVLSRDLDRSGRMGP